MKNLIILAVVVFSFPGAVLADTWAFDGSEKIEKQNSQNVVETYKNQNFSWAFDSETPKVYGKK